MNSEAGIWQEAALEFSSKHPSILFEGCIFFERLSAARLNHNRQLGFHIDTVFDQGSLKNITPNILHFQNFAVAAVASDQIAQ